jgi:hypothetical protein
MAIFLSKKHLSRRTFLRSSSVAVALPMLDSMLGAATALAQSGAAPATRFCSIYFPHGATMSKWTPETEGHNFVFSDILKPLEPHRDWITVVSDLTHQLAYGPGGATANHNRSAAAFLTGAKAQNGAQPRLGISADQLAVQYMGQDTPLPSIELAIEEASLSCGEGMSCAYRNTISWQSESVPLPMQNNPQAVFEQLFGDGATEEQRLTRRKQSLSLLDSVTEQVKALNKSLPANDRQRVDQYLSDIREIERRIVQTAEQVSEDELDIPAKPAGIPVDVEDHIRLMYDLLVLAWQADISRVSTLLLAKELSNAIYPKSGVRDSFHTLSHHSNNEENKLRFALINNYHVDLFAYFVNKLRNTPDGDGNLLDHSLILYGSGMSDGNSHNHTPLPVLLAGRASGKVRGNQHIRNPDNTPMSNLLLGVLDKLGVEKQSFGDSNGVVTL